METSNKRLLIDNLAALAVLGVQQQSLYVSVFPRTKEAVSRIISLICFFLPPEVHELQVF